MQDGSMQAWRQQKSPPSSPSAPVLNARWLAAQQVQVGLQNMGNTCYCNSVLACLAFLPPLANLLRGCVAGPALHHGATCHIPTTTKCAACLLSRQILAMLADGPRILKPIHIVTNLHTFSKTFRRGRQEDSHEFFHCLLDAVERDSKQPAANGSKTSNKAQGAATLIEQLFQGRSLSQVRCLECGYESNTFELFCSLSLDIGKAASVQDSLHSFTAVEYLEGANKYKCDRCKALVRARKQVALWDEPNVLTLHLKRFAAPGCGGGGSGKLGRHVRFPALLDLEPFMAHGLTALPGVSSAPHYALSGVLVHQGGSVHSGHYYAYVMDSAGAWSCVNDEQVQRVALEHVLQQQAYMLFYVRRAAKAARQPPGPGPQQQQHQAEAAAGPQAETAPGFIGPQMPPGPCSPLGAKRSREVYEGPQPYSPRVLGPSPGPGVKVTTVMPSGAARTTVLPAKLPAKLPAQQQQQQQQQGAVAGPVGNGAGAGALKVRVIPGAAGAKAAAANGHAGPSGAKPHAEGLGSRAAVAHAGETQAPVPRSQEPTPRERVKAQLLQELRTSKFRAAVEERFQAFFIEGLSPSDPAAWEGPLGPGEAQRLQALLDELLQQLQPGAERSKAQRAQLRLQLPRLDPGFMSGAQAAVAALLPPPTR